MPVACINVALAQCAKPVVISNAATICSGGSTTLTTGVVAGASYAWSNGASGNTCIVGAGSYTVTVTYSGGCSNTSDPVIIKEKTFGAVVPSANPALCPGQSLTLYADTGNIWRRATDNPGVARIAPVSFTIGSKGYIGTGAWASQYSDWWEYDEATETWTQKADVPGGGRSYGVAFSIGTKGYVGLGNGPTAAQSDFYEFDPFANTWTAKANYPGGGTVGANSFAIGSLGYVCLGNSAAGAPQTGWSFDPATDTWTPIANFPGAGRREGMSFSLNNKGYVTCGWLITTPGQPDANDCWQYDPATNSWTAQPSLPGYNRRTGSSFTIQDHGYIVCGYDNTPGNIGELWEFYNGNWTKKTSYPGLAQWGIGSFGLHDKAMVVFGVSGSTQAWMYYPNNTVQWPGGSTATSHTINSPGSYSATIHDIEGCSVTTTPLTVTSQSLTAVITSSGPTTFCDGITDTLYANGDTWTQKQDYPNPDAYSSGFAIGAYGYYCGGNSLAENWRYDPVSNTWSQRAKMPTNLYSTPCISWNGKVYFTSNTDKTMWEYDPENDAWARKAIFPGAAGAPNMMQGFLINNQYILAGGINTSNAAVAEVWSYDLLNDKWTRKNDMPYAMAYAAAFSLNGKGYMCTGNSTRDGAAGPQSASFLQYDPTTDSWTSLPDFPGGARSAAIAFTDGKKAYVGMGNHGPVLSDLWQYDPGAQTWTRMRDIPKGRYGASCFVIGHYAYVAAGIGSSGYLKDLWQYELPYNYTWSTGATSHFIKVTTTGDYSVTVSSDEGCSSASTPVHITVQPKTVINTPPQNVTICDALSTGFTTSASGTSITYQWQLNGSDVTDGGVYSGATTNALAVSNVTGLGAGLFRCIVTGTCGKDTTATATLTVNPLPAKPVIAAGGPTTFCIGSSVALNSPVATTYAWSTGDATQGINVSTAGSYTVKVTDGNGCTSPLSDPVTVIVNALPAKPVIAAGGPTTFCAGGSVTLNSPPSTTYTWSTGDATQNINVSSSGSYTVKVTDANGCTSPLSDPVAVTVNALPAKPVITPGGPTTFCAGGSVMLNSPAASLYTWSTGAATQSIPVNTSGSYTVKTTDANGCVSPSSDPVTVTVNALPAKPVITPGGPTTFCSGGSVALNSSAALGNTWSTAATTQGITINSTGSYTVRVTDGNGCVSPISDAITVTVNGLPAKPAITASGATTFCQGGSVTLSSPAAAVYTWSNGGATQKVTINQSGTYTLQITDGNGCHSPISDGIAVTVNPLPAAPVINASGPLSFCDGNSVMLASPAASAYQWSTGSHNQTITVSRSGNFYVQVTDANGCTSPPSSSVTVQVNQLPSGSIYSVGPMVSGNTHYIQLTAPQTTAGQYAWSTGDNTSVVQVTQSGTYSVIVTTAQGCKQTFQTNVQLIDLSQIPNTFSPNHDGINDYWYVKAMDAFPNASVMVFNRNGNKVWEGKGTGIRWDGTSNGHELPAGVYFYVLDLKDGSKPVNGWVNLLR